MDGTCAVVAFTGERITSSSSSPTEIKTFGEQLSFLEQMQMANQYFLYGKMKGLDQIPTSNDSHLITLLQGSNDPHAATSQAKSNESIKSNGSNSQCLSPW